jgi:hypothetical protein
VHDLLNPCECGDNCQCGAPDLPAEVPVAAPKNVTKGLAVLAQAAALLDNIHLPKPKITKAVATKAKKRARDGSVSPTIRPAEPKRNKQISDLEDEIPKSSCCSAKKASSAAAPTLPPLSLFGSHATFTPAPLPKVPLLAPSSSAPVLTSAYVESVAASGCCCGFQCSCPGCTEHRGTNHAEPGHGDCASGDCPTCVDHQSGLGLQVPVPLPPFNFAAAAASSVPAPSATAIDALFARPPPSRPAQSSVRQERVPQPAAAQVASGSCCGSKK